MPYLIPQFVICFDLFSASWSPIWLAESPSNCLQCPLAFPEPFLAFCHKMFQAHFIPSLPLPKNKLCLQKPDISKLKLVFSNKT